MLFDARKIMCLLEKVADKSNKPLEHAHFPVFSEAINSFLGDEQVSKRYLYDNVYKKTKRALEDGKSEVGLSSFYINLIANYLGYRNFQDFAKESVDTQLSPQLANCLGLWYSYVRANSGKKELLMSPVRIYQEGSAVYMELRGKQRSFTGGISQRAGCLCCTLHSSEDKELHLVFRLGIAMQPTLLKGVFSGISSGGDPIGGREILVHASETDISQMENRKISFQEVNELISTESSIDTRILQYFQSYHKNCISVGRSSTFDLDDLELS